MVLEKTVDNLKSQSKDDKTAVAGGTALVVVIILLIVWGFFFLKKIRSGAPLEFGSGAQDEFNFSTVRDAQQQIEDSFKYSQEELRAIRDSAAEGSGSQQLQQVDVGVRPPDGFGVPDEE